MGNNPSKSSGSAPQSPASHGSSHINNVRREPRRRESIQALSNVKATAAPPSASLESATAHSTARSVRTHSRSRSQTGPPHLTRQLDSSNNSPQSQLSSTPASMGNQQSAEKRSREAVAPSPSTKPVAVPAPPPVQDPYSRTEHTPGLSHDTPQENYHVPPSQYTRPPRLPLPIEEEVHTPGSPIISPADLSSPIDPIEVDGAIPRRTSVLSSTTVDDDDVGDEHTAETTGQPAVPTVIEWLSGGEKVYVTGTFAGWDRKYRLHREGPSKNKDALSATIPLVPGTHHLKFIVDGEMKTADQLPTAVDFTNILVNYIEISPDDLPVAPAKPVDIPGKQTRQEELKSQGIYPPQALPPSPEPQPAPPPVDTAPAPTPSKATPVTNDQAPIVPGPPKQYHNEIPKWLIDFDAPEESSRFHRANNAVNTCPAPPTLPMFLTKSILNSATPMKDDSSVLVFPNHTVLNHLATTSIRSNVLATSATTRYKRKFLTTIMYKPTSDSGE